MIPTTKTKWTDLQFTCQMCKRPTRVSEEAVQFLIDQENRMAADPEMVRRGHVARTREQITTEPLEDFEFCIQCTTGDRLPGEHFEYVAPPVATQVFVRFTVEHDGNADVLDLVTGACEIATEGAPIEECGVDAFTFVIDTPFEIRAANREEELAAAARFALDQLEHMTSSAFAHGADKVVRERLLGALGRLMFAPGHASACAAQRGQTCSRMPGCLQDGR